MMNQNKLLSLLSDGGFHSGSDLGGLMGVSRTSVWKAIPGLQELNVPIEIIKGKGYRIPGGLDLLDKNKILSMLPHSIKSSVELDILLSVPSTNDCLATSNESSPQNYRICLAEHQSLGRGRRGRVWVSPFAKNIYFSAGFSLGGGVESLSGLSLVVGLAVARALKALGVKGVGLKWPNDIYIHGKKVAGVLVELSGEATTGWKVICGIGINVHMGVDEGAGIDQEWCSLSEAISIGRNHVVAELLCELIRVLDDFKREGFNCFLEEWSGFDVLKGKVITVKPGSVEGCVVGVNLQGALLVRSGEGELVINAGEVSVREK